MRFIILLILFFPLIILADQSAIIITQPINNYTYQNNESGDVKINIKLVPDFQPQQKLQVLLDSKSVGLFSTVTINLKNIDRGEHHLQIILLSANGKIITSSKIITFFMQRPIVKKYL